ncbi:MAG: serine hydrolase domain-containing protein [Janthinobacterium lividum]
MLRPIIMATYGLLLSLSLLPAGLLAQPAHSFHSLDGRTLRPADIDRTVRTLLDSAHVPGGLAIALFEHNRLRFLRTYGYRNVASQAPLEPQTSMYGASLSKAVFAYLVMQLVQERQLDLDRPLYQYLPKPLPDYEAYRDLAGDFRWQRLTARMALTHTTGLPNWRWISSDKKLHFKFDPGTQYWYSGEGLQLLQLVVEAITQQSLVQLSEARIFRPLGMTHTSYVWQPAFEKNYALGYDEQGKPLEKHRRTKAGAAGSMETTPTDYAIFLMAVMQGRGLTPAAKQQLTRTQVRIPYRGQFGPLATVAAPDSNRSIRLGYGLGWGTFDSIYGHAYFKEGHDDGWENHSVVFGDQRKAILLLGNSSKTDTIYMALLARLLGDSSTPAQWENYQPYRQSTP